MTALSHLQPNFESVFSIEAVNEPIMNATQTPGYGECKHISNTRPVVKTRSPLGCSVQKNFVLTLRAVELLLGIDVEGYLPLQGIPRDGDMSSRLANACRTDNSGLFDPESAVVKALTEAFSILPCIIQQLGCPVDYNTCQGHTALTAKPVFSPSAAAVKV
jgi:glucan endo-1,6-beta-glucosidase